VRSSRPSHFRFTGCRRRPRPSICATGWKAPSGSRATTFAIRAPAALDHGLTHISLTEFALEIADNPQRPLAVNAAAQSEYARLSGKPVAALTQAMEAWLPIAIVRYFVLMGGPTSERWRRLMQRAEAALRPQH